jgi:hypothetical protein
VISSLPGALTFGSFDQDWFSIIIETSEPIRSVQRLPPEPERLAYSPKEFAAMIGEDYFSVCRLIQRGNCAHAGRLRGKLLVPRLELLRLLKG